MIGCAGAKPANRIHRLSQDVIDKDQRLRDIQQSTSRLIRGGVPIVVQKIEMNVYQAIDNAEVSVEAMMDFPLVVGGEWVIWVEGHDDMVHGVRYTVEVSPRALVNVQYIGEV